MSEVTILDGSMGQELVRRIGDVNHANWGIGVMRDRPDLVREVHAAYLQAGAQVLSTNSYNIQRPFLDEFGYGDELATLTRLACDLARQAVEAHGDALIAGSLGPLGASYRPDLGNDGAEAVPLFAEVAEVMGPHVDVVLVETMSSIPAARAGLEGARAAGKPLWLSITVDDADGTRMRSGAPVSEAIALADEFGARALLVNCSRPEAVRQAMPLLAEAPMPTGAYANGFTGISEAYLKDANTLSHLESRRDLGPAEYAGFAQAWADAGATLIGGCCEVGPAHIAELTRRFG